MAADATLFAHGPEEPRVPLVLDSPHSGTDVPDDMRAAVSDFDLAEGCDSFVDELWQPAIEHGAWLLAARAMRTYLDCNRNAGDIDLELIEGGAWPGTFLPSGKARIGKALVWRMLDDGRPIYDRRLSVAEVARRIDRCHAPYHRALAARIDATHERFGASWHIDCHSMNAVGGAQAEGGAGQVRADIVLGDRDGTSCEPAFTAFVAAELRALGYEVKINDPFKGVELVRAYADPARGRSSLQIEVNKRLYMDEAKRERNAGFAPLQRKLHHLIEAIVDYIGKEVRRG